MTSPFENLSGPGKPLKAERRIVTDLVAACQVVAAKVDALGAISK